jgi:uncharacterized protein YecT (DUF1311 family)
VRQIFFAVPVLTAMGSLPAGAEMFGPGFQPCGKETSTLAVVECVQEKINAADRRLNAAYKALQAPGGGPGSTGSAVDQVGNNRRPRC